ncbi:hypothetical protein ALTER154_80156 [Alteromonas sp. 154]|nr:hypothetical protein ALTER154_80156 [Alteromonas sp. 154]
MNLKFSNFTVYTLRFCFKTALNKLSLMSLLKTLNDNIEIIEERTKPTRENKIDNAIEIHSES